MKLGIRIWLPIALASAAPYAAFACAQKLAHSADPRVTKMIELAQKQRETIIDQFGFFFGDFMRQRGFPVTVKQLGADELEKWEALYAADLRTLVLQAPQKRVKLATDTFGLNAPASAHFLSEAFKVYLVQYYLANAMAVYRREMKPYERSRRTLSRYNKERIFKQALIKVSFYTRPGLSDVQAFGAPVTIRRPSLQEAHQLRVSVPADVREFLAQFDRAVADAGIHLGREYAYYLDMLRRLWVP